VKIGNFGRIRNSNYLFDFSIAAFFMRGMIGRVTRRKPASPSLLFDKSQIEISTTVPFGTEQLRAGRRSLTSPLLRKIPELAALEPPGKCSPRQAGTAALPHAHSVNW